MPAIPKIAGSACAISSLYDIHKTAMIYSKQELQKAMGDTIVSSSIGNQKANHISYKDSKRKNWTGSNHFMSSINEAYASTKGYIKGAFQGIARYFPRLVLSAVAIIPKKTNRKLLSKIPYISTILLAGVEIYDYLKNGTGLFERTDYLKRK